MSSNQPETDVAAQAPAPANVLRILSGLHAGASRTLGEQEMILVGSGDDCDIVLADNGVARHHALVNLTAGLSSLRALDAPLRVDGQPLHPGDPLELRGLQRIQLGDAAIAFGMEDDPRWATLLPEGAPLPGGSKRVPGTGMRKLPLVAALAVLSLASLAIFAAVMPQHEKPVDPRTQLEGLISEFKINGGTLHKQPDGTFVLSGTVANNRTRDSIEQRVRQIRQQGVDATLDLRSGEKIAADVREVLRAENLDTTTRYLGNGVVEVSGKFQDMGALAKVSQSRAMKEVAGAKHVYVKNYQPGQGDEHVARTGGKAAAAAEPTRIVKVVREGDRHVVALDGTEYRVGDQIPGLGQLAMIGENVQVLDAQKTPHKVKIQPVTAEELAAAAEQAATANAPQDGAAPAAVDGAADKADTATAAKKTTTSTADRRVASAEKNGADGSKRKEKQ